MNEFNFTSSPAVGRISESTCDLDSGLGDSTFETPDKRRRIVTFKETPAADTSTNFSESNEKHDGNTLSEKSMDIKQSPSVISKSEMLRRNFRATLDGVVEKITKFVSEVERVELQERLIVMKQMKEKIENVRNNLVEEKKQFSDCIEKLRSTLG